MKKKATALIATVLCAGMLLTGCITITPPASPSNDDSSASETSAPEVSEPEVSEPEISEPEVSEPETSEAVSSGAESSAPAKTESSAPAKDKAEKKPSGKYIDIGKMQFSINGKTYTLGKSTLQELVDDGAPFREDDLANINNNVNKNSTAPFTIEVGEYWSGSVYASNFTDGNMAAKDCIISEIYLPLHDDETQDIVEFSFPQDMTMDDLKKNAGEPTDSRHYDGDDDYYSDTLEYTEDSEKYIGDRGYTFEFINGKLRYITIKYLP